LSQPFQKPINEFTRIGPWFEMGKTCATTGTEEHKLGETRSRFADGTAHKNRMRETILQSACTTRCTCFSCHIHGTNKRAQLIKPRASLLIATDRHVPKARMQPQLNQRTCNRNPGNDASAHMPKIATQLADVNVRSIHSFRAH